MADPAAADPTPSPAAPASDPPAATVTDPPASAPADPPKPADPPADPPAAAKAPEKYDFAGVKMPEGLTLDEGIMKAIEPVFRELDLTQDQAAKLISVHAEAVAEANTAAEAKREQDFVEFMAKKTAEYKDTIRKEWGSAHDANLATAQRAIGRYLDDEAKAVLNDTGLGNHPAFLRFFFKVGQSVTEDMPPLNGGTPPANDARSFYPNSSHAS